MIITSKGGTMLKDIDSDTVNLFLKTCRKEIKKEIVILLDIEV